jgi:hypothetical protein
MTVRGCVEAEVGEYIIRAERKLGEILKDAKAAGQITKIPGNKREHVPAENILTTLAQAGIDRNLSSRAQNLAKVPKHD